MRLLPRSPVARLGVRAGFLTSKQRAERLVMSRYYLLKLEQGALKPSPRVIEKMSEAYGVDADTLKKYFREVRNERLSRESI